MKEFFKESLYVVVPLVLIFVGHQLIDNDSEPYFNNDETRHVMTGVFFRDLIADRPADNPKQYAVNYYLQYPALGLMVWPPIFYAVEGVWMSCFGTSFASAKALVAGFGVVVAIYFYRLVRRSQSRLMAGVAVGVLGFTPLVFASSRQVMLEIPCLALVLASIFHFERDLEGGKRRDAWGACVLAALAALTRFDGIFLLPYFALRLISTGNLSLLRRGSVIGAILLALAPTGPYYWFTLNEYGSTIAKTAQEGSSARAATFFGSENFIYYPSRIPEQVGWVTACLAGIGFAYSLTRSEFRKTMGPEFTLLASTYMFFAPIAEIDERHTIYWVPALVIFAIAAVTALGQRVGWRWLAIPVCVAMILNGVFKFSGDGPAVTLRKPSYYLFGYEEAAAYVVENNRDTRICLFDGFLNGGFIYYLRRHDPERAALARCAATSSSTRFCAILTQATRNTPGKSKTCWT